MTSEFLLTLLGLAIAACVQNVAFTAVSRSRNSGDVLYHAKWSLASNGIWFAMQIFLMSGIWRAVEHGTLWQIGVYGVVYVIGTTAGSCWMMQRMLKSEAGNRRVGAR